jgi:hypothetical protein
MGIKLIFPVFSKKLLHAANDVAETAQGLKGRVAKKK